jgi:hypothetical protein
VVDYLSHFPPKQRQRILLGALGSVYGKGGETGADTAVWLDVLGDEALSVGGNGLAFSPALAATGWSLWWSIRRGRRWRQCLLRQVGVLDEVVETVLITFTRALVVLSGRVEM